ncbi:HpcH/HpaI aldolase family protein [Sinanaerobacter chloroacetimidivorans]|uniref:HpcH/HpaI aldolase/citrate lyase domain-containing protein n=1 Tax=Sinanaerobacter chloroacetimidivorans TaxID=2818044 RepID=A0A8J7VZS9_9FIRM|nr:aldolase/citrate lyase family protein [Sinanaerobacter chloroacetimidivorans]MBR0596551.1 hypothetical protein [Sinanaerobacter chloroacetimidivorans]
MVGMKALIRERPLFGTFVKTTSPEIVEMIALAGFDFILIDTEHSPFTYGQVKMLTSIAQGMGMKVVVRPPDFSRSNLQYSLDLGADGVQAPQLYDEEDAKTIVSLCKYQPIGTRGITFSHRASQYGFCDSKAYVDAANHNVMINVHIETREALERVNQIAAIEGVDLLFLGPADLSYSLGCDSDIIAGGLKDAFLSIKNAAQKHGKMVGTLINSEEKLKFCLDHDVRFIVWETDLSMLKKQLESVVNIIQSHYK